MFSFTHSSCSLHQCLVFFHLLLCSNFYFFFYLLLFPTIWSKSNPSGMKSSDQGHSGQKRPHQCVQTSGQERCLCHKSAGNGTTATSHHFDKRQEGKSKCLFAFLTFSRK
ncbi:unnamed protein product [Rangifer tarandus platyrhynchus]|uniref:Uncharacterized protein n=1 Tax=Rangifer tarandus platyrhynchus TaxID=3082113 RepID=A0AC60AA35_RANTA